jgi:hypothetical protein
MKNDNPNGRRLQFASTGQRLLSLMVLGMCVALLYAAWSGRYDREVNHVAGWMRTHWNAMVH